MISVAMTTYNGEKFVQEQIISIINQTKKVDEIIICDDCSTDHTTEIIQSLQNQYKDFNIKLYFNEKNLGYRENFKKAISLCTGDYIFLSDQDDIWKEKKIEEMTKKMQMNANIEVLASSFTYIDENSTLLKGEEKNNTLYLGNIVDKQLKPIKFEELLVHNYFQGCTLVMNKAMNEIFLTYFTNQIPHDWLIVILSAARQSMYFWNSPLSYYRIHSNNTIGVDNLGKSKFSILKEKFTYTFRSKYARDGLNLINALCDSQFPFDVDRIQTMKECEEFFNAYLVSLQKGKMIDLSNASYRKYYYMFRTKNGALIDRIYCLLH